MNTDSKYIEQHQLIEMFLSERDVEPITKRQYKFNLRKFFQWVKTRNIDHYELTKADILLYKKYLQDQNKEELTISNYLTTIKIFYKWTEQSDIFPDITTSIRTKKNYRDFKKKSLTIKEANELLRSFGDKSLIQKRDKAIGNLLLRNGIRATELIHLDVGDLRKDGEEISIKIQRKGHRKKDSTIPVSLETFKIIHEYLLERNDNWEDHNPLFVSTSNANKNGRLSTNFISMLIKRKLIQIGLKDSKYTAHSLRHTTATLLLHNGTPINEIQLLLGHSSYSITQIYTREKNLELLFKNNLPNQMDEILK